MLRGCLTVTLIIAGILLIGAAAVASDPCKDDAAATFAIVLGSLSFGAAAFLVVAARTPRTWIAVLTTIATTLVVAFGSGAFALLRWAGECSN
jgi:uncharacterized membrane protein YedE/YeeE